MWLKWYCGEFCPGPRCQPGHDLAGCPGGQGDLVCEAPGRQESRWRSSSVGDSSFLLVVFLERYCSRVGGHQKWSPRPGASFEAGETGGQEGWRCLGHTRAEPRTTPWGCHLPPSGTHPGPSFSQGTGPRDECGSHQVATLDKYHNLFHIYYGQQFD